MRVLNAVQTQAQYVDALTVGPDEFEAIAFVVFNATVQAQVYQLGSGAHYQGGTWSDELLIAASAEVSGSGTVERTGGIRFRTNPATPGNAGRITCWAWRDGEPRITAQVSTGAAQSSGGGVTQTAMLTGRVDSAGNVLAGTGFTVTYVGVGTYDVTFNAAYAAVPVTLVQLVETAAGDRPAITNQTTSGVRVLFTADRAFDFIVQQVS